MTTRYITIIVAAGCLLLTACKEKPNPCIAALLERDKALDKQIEALMIEASDTSAVYRTAVLKLRDEEQNLFADVENCDFGKDRDAYNYWYRGRMKFPGKIRQEVHRLGLDKAK